MTSRDPRLTPKQKALLNMRRTARHAAEARLGGHMRLAQNYDDQIERIYREAKRNRWSEGSFIRAEEDGREAGGRLHSRNVRHSSRRDMTKSRRPSRDEGKRVERGDTIEYLGTAHDDAGKPLRGRTGVVEEFYGKTGPSGRRFMMRVRFGSKSYDMSQDAPLRIVKHARRHHRSRYPSGQHKPRFRVGQTVKFRARTYHGSPVSYGRVVAISGLREHGEQPLYSVRLPNGVRTLVHQDSLTAAPRSKASRDR